MSLSPRFLEPTIQANISHSLISREPSQFPRGEEFIPERWIDPSYPTYKEPLTEYPHIRGDIAFGYGNRACPGVDLTNVELFTLFGALAWSFNIRKKEPDQVVPWYEVNPYVITMCKPFPLIIEARSEEKKRFILDGCPEPGYWLKSKSETRWDIQHENGEKITYGEDRKAWTWDGLSVPYEKPATPKVYPPGV